MLNYNGGRERTFLFFINIYTNYTHTVCDANYVTKNLPLNFYFLLTDTEAEPVSFS